MNPDHLRHIGRPLQPPGACPDCDRQRGHLTDRGDELLREAVELLMRATANSLDPAERKAWDERRDALIERAKAALL